MQVQSIAGNQSKRGSNFRWDHQTTLLTHHKCGIHGTSVPRAPSLWHRLDRLRRTCLAKRLNRSPGYGLVASVAVTRSPKRVARFNMRVTNRVTRTYRIPVSALPQPGGYRFALTDGADSDRVKNVPAAGGCHIRAGRHDVTLVEPGGGSDPALVLGVVPRSVDPAPRPRGGIPRPHRPDTPDPAGQPAGGGCRPPHTVSR